MRVGLFVPCHVDQLYPDVAFAALELLEAEGLSVDVPRGQTCCGQLLVNLGAVSAAEVLARRFDAQFAAHDYVVCPSGSCTAALHRQLPHAAVRVMELSQFLVTVLGGVRARVRFPHRVALHESCHGLRELGLGRASELGAAPHGGGSSPARQLLRAVRDLELVEPERADECCGFGGSFAIAEAAVSARMGSDRLDDFERARAEVVTSIDTSCLAHLSGLARRQRRSLRTLHLAQLLAGRAPPGLEGKR